MSPLMYAESSTNFKSKKVTIHEYQKCRSKLLK